MSCIMAFRLAFVAGATLCLALLSGCGGDDSAEDPDVPDHETITRFGNILREFEVGGYRIWRYMKVEARPGRELFFGTK